MRILFTYISAIIIYAYALGKTKTVLIYGYASTLKTLFKSSGTLPKLIIYITKGFSPSNSRYPII